MILIEPYVKFIIKHNLTQHQLLFLFLVYYKRFDLLKEYKETFSPNGEPMLEDFFLQDLIKKEFLVVKHSGFSIGKKFLNVFINEDTATEQIFNAYPQFLTTSEGVDIPLTAMDRQVFKSLYISKIMGSVDEHIEVMKDIQYGIENGLMSIGINKFVTSEYWKALRKQRLEVLEVKENKLYDDF